MLNLRNVLVYTAALMVSLSAFAENLPPSVLQKRTIPGIESRKKTGAGGGRYKFILFSDTHLDGAQYHPDQKNYTSPHAVMWQGKMQSMLHAAASKIDGDMRFVLHAGDITDGDKVKQPDLFLKLLKDATGYLKSEFPSVPVIIVAGNHDKRHINKELYDRFIKKYLTSEMKRKIGRTTFYFMEGPDLFLCIDFNEPDLDVMRKALNEHANARYKFILSHGPVIPSEVWESGLFENNPEERWEFRELFLKNDVIVLTGHVHSLEYVCCETDSGSITQLLTCSTWMPQLGNEPQTKISGTEKYMYLNPNLSLNGHRLLAEYRNAVTEYAVFADRNSDLRQPKIQESGAGYYILTVDSHGVTADFYPGNTTGKPEWTIRLR